MLCIDNNIALTRSLSRRLSNCPIDSSYIALNIKERSSRNNRCTFDWVIDWQTVWLEWQRLLLLVLLLHCFWWRSQKFGCEIE